MTLPSCSACVATAHLRSAQRPSPHRRWLCVEDSALLDASRTSNMVRCPATQARACFARTCTFLIATFRVPQVGCCGFDPRNHLLVLLIHLRKVPCSTWRTALYYLAQHVHVSLRALLRGKYRDAGGCKQLSVRVCGACRPPDGVVRGRPAAHAHAPPRARFPHTPSRR